MAVVGADEKVGQQEGLYMTGRFLGVKSGSYTTRSGEERERHEIALLVGASMVNITYRSMAEVNDALGGKAPEQLGWITLAVWANGPWDEKAGRRSVVRYSGRVTGE